MMTADQNLAFSIACSAADTLDSLGRLMLTPIAAYVILFPVIMVFGGFGRGQISSFIGTIELYFGSRTKLKVFGVFLLSGAVGGGLLAAPHGWGSGCAL